MSKHDLTKPTRQSAKGLVFIFLIGIQKSIRALWPIVLVYIVKLKDFDNKLYMGIGVLTILVFLIVHSVLYYLHFYFYIKDEEFILKKGYLRKKVLSIPLDRIQSVNTKQNLVQQVLNVLTLEIDTAGSVAKELKIHALEKSFAQELQEQLSKGRQKNEPEIRIEEEAQEEKLILKLSPIDLFKIGISENHIRTGLIILAFGFQIFQKVEDVFEEKANEYSNEFTNYLSNSDWALITFLIVTFLVLSFLISLIRTVYKYFDFKLLKKKNIYRVEAGLLNKRNVLIPMNKVQELNWKTGPIKQWLGIYNIVFKQAVSGQNKRNQMVDAPGCLEHHLEELKTDLFGGDQFIDLEKHYSNSYYFRRLWMIMGWIPIILASGFLFREWIYWAIAIAWLVSTAGYSLLILKKSYFKINTSQIRISKGAIEHKWKHMELFKIQSVEFNQTIFQKRKSLASLKLTNASGSMTIPFINEIKARQIYDYLLFHTETSRRKWM